MIAGGVLFLLTIIVGRAITTITRRDMMRALDQINATLDVAAATGAALESLFSLLPVFEVFIAKGQLLEEQEMTCVKVWAAWAIIWLVVRRFRSLWHETS